MNSVFQPVDRRIVIAAWEMPGEGGASTATYALFRKMQASGFDVHLINIIDETDEAYFRYVFGERMGNPDALRNVHNCILRQAEFYDDPGGSPLNALLKDIAPDVAVGVDCIPALMLKRVAPQINVVFLACGSEQTRLRINRSGMSDAMAVQSSLEPDDFPPVLFNSRESQAVKCCDLVIANSTLTRDLYRLYYPSFAGKIANRPVWFSEWICEDAALFSELARPFPEREIDLLFVASSWRRGVKNWRMAQRVIADCHDLESWVVGTLDRACPDAHCTGLVDSRRALFEIMGNARAVVSTSKLDTSPGVLFEAAVMGCNVVASRNCGNWELCHPELLVERYDHREFAARCRKAAMGKLEDRLGDFIAQGGYQTLLDSVAVL